jgi:predicted amidohydrolase
MKVYLGQLDSIWEDKPANLRKARELVSRAHPAPGSLFVLPEMFPTGFSMNVAATAEESAPGTMPALESLAREFRIFIQAGIVSRTPEGKGLNQAVVISPEGKELTRYTKIHPFTLGGELANYDRGTEIKHYEWEGIQVTPFICYDLRFPEIFRTAVKRGAEMFVVIAAWPNKREHHWVTLLQARAIENLAYVIGVNRAGTDPHFVYPGRSMVIDPHGKILVDAGANEGVVSAEIDPTIVRTWRKDFPALQDIHWREER